jgi:hypothetical protein
MLPDDLARLGSTLETATNGSVRRRARRQALLNAVAAVFLAVPLAIAVSAAPLAPSAGLPLSPSPSATTPEMSFLLSVPIGRRTDFRHIPDEPLPAVEQVCLDANDCRMPYVPSLYPAPAGRV